MLEARKAAFTLRYGTGRTRQKLLVVMLGVLVRTRRPPAPAGLVASGTQLTGERVKLRSSA